MSTMSKGLATLGMVAAGMAAVLVLLVLEHGKAEHRLSGGHEPTKHERCYVQRGCTELSIHLEQDGQ